MSLATGIYNTVFRRNSIFIGTVFTGAFFFGVGFDMGVTGFWERWNKGKLWKDIRHNYVQDAE